MDKEAIGGGAIGGAGRAMLTIDFGRTRLAGLLNAAAEPRTAAAGRDEAAAARRDRAAAAMRP